MVREYQTIISPNDLIRLFKCIENNTDKLIISLMVKHGIDLSKLSTDERNKIIEDAKDNTIKYPYNYSVYVEIEPSYSEWIRENSQMILSITRKQINDIVKQLCKKSGLNFTINALIKTCIVRMYNEGINIVDISGLLNISFEKLIRYLYTCTNLKQSILEIEFQNTFRDTFGREPNFYETNLTACDINDSGVYSKEVINNAFGFELIR
jgi:hypothetical protein